ncbi:SGNH/GDSL hydrolase family protein [Psychrobacter sp. PSP]|uniref:SGNH/GDSL hydrolase family protein n=1 Tax=Psychrobacter sp. PSP TaxID=2734636 RepID=UPI00209638BA|nr:SGNH/GDSL hydrolase family protein [Psychrobacter sp. PSP]
MADALTIQGMIDANVDVNTIEQAALEDMIVTARNGREFPSAPRAVRLILEQGTIDAFLFLTKADLDTGNALGSDTPVTLVDDDFGLVLNDETLDNNGYYQMRQGELVWLNLNVARQGLEQIEQAKQAAIAAAATDAQNKANVAQSAAIAAAATNTSDKIALKLDGVVGKNLFDKTKSIAGLALNDTGGTFNTPGRNVSSYIAVKPNVAYSFSNINKAVFYDSNKAFVQLSNGANANVISATSAAFVRIDISDSSLNTAQIELGAVKTSYEAYRVIIADKAVTTAALQDNSVSSDKLQTAAVSAKHFADATFLNMHDASTLRKGLTISLTDGKTETPAASVDVTAYIPCKPSKAYIANEMSRVLFYRADGSFISASADKAFITPSDCTQLRFNLSSAVSYRFQLNAGTVLPSVIPQPYKFSLDKLHVTPQTKLDLNKTLARKYSFLDAWIAWRDGQKFPICFLGDSTTNGNGTTGFVYRDAGASLGQDYIAPSSYTSIFQSLIREITGNTQMRAYNAGFSGRNSTWALANIDAIMGEAYADAKMIGISHGINDRTASAALYATNFYREIEGLIKWCFEHGYQPFLMTTQPMTMPLYIGDGDGSDTEEVANGIKKTLADKYGLELVDVNKWGQDFMQYSTKPLLNNIMESGGNIIHFGDGGHKYTAELLFARFCQRCIWTTTGEQLDYSTQLNKSDINHTYISQLAAGSFKQGFKNQTLATHADATDKKYQEYWVFNASRQQLGLTAYYANAVVGQYVLVDGVQTTITMQGQSLGSLDLGLHKIKAYSSPTTALDWLGFKLQ